MSADYDGGDTSIGRLLRTKMNTRPGVGARLYTPVLIGIFELLIRAWEMNTGRKVQRKNALPPS